MTLIYNIFIQLYRLIILIAANFHSKAKLFIEGRKDWYHKISSEIKSDNREKIWFHCASLGEFEQCKPLLEAIQNKYDQFALVLTFFSPSGYENIKNKKVADYVFYLPLDTNTNARRFISLINPHAAFFIKYEFWYHYLNNLHLKKIPVFLVSAIFQDRQPFFKWYGGLHRKMLSFYTAIFVQDQPSKDMIAAIDSNSVIVAGDTRFDRVNKILNQPKTYNEIETFKGTNRLLVAGSTWAEDEILLHEILEFIPLDIKILIVPHEINDHHINNIKSIFKDKYCLWKDNDCLLRNKRVCMVNDIGHLAYLYRYADMAWIGGGFNKTGIHNSIEAAIYGIPIFFGPNYNRYREAIDLIKYNAAISVKHADQLVNYILDQGKTDAMQHNAVAYVAQQLGATNRIMNYLEEKCVFKISKNS